MRLSSPAQPCLVCSFGAGGSFGEPSSCFAWSCQVSSSSWQHGPTSRRSTSPLINIIQSRQLRQLLSERQGQEEWEMKLWHFRQLPLLLFLTPPPCLAAHFQRSQNTQPAKDHDGSMYPPWAKPQPMQGLYRRARPRSSWTLLATPSLPARPPAARWQRRRLITSRVRERVSLQRVFSYFLLSKSLTAFT